MKTLSIVIPAFNETPTLEATIIRIREQVLREASYQFTLVVVDDGSNDPTWPTIETLAARFSDVRGIKLSRNFGKDSAVLAGLSSQKADLYLVIDADGEHPISMIADFLKKQRDTQAHVVHGVKQSRDKQGFFYGMSRRLFNRVFKRTTSLDLVESSDFKLMTATFVDNLISFGEYDFFFRAVAQLQGFKSECIYFEEGMRESGSTSWTTSRLYMYAFNALLNFTHFPIYLILALGLFALGISVALGAKVLWFHTLGRSPEGYSTLLLVNLISLSLITTCLGIIGLYVVKIHREVKRRPRFLIEATTGKSAL